MKKIVTTILLSGAFISALLPAMADNDTFLRRLKICSGYSDTYYGKDNKAYKRTVIGVQPNSTGLGCQYSQEMENNKKLKCSFPMGEMKSVVSSFSNNEQKKMLEAYVDSGVCTLE